MIYNPHHNAESAPAILRQAIIDELNDAARRDIDRSRDNPAFVIRRMAQVADDIFEVQLSVTRMMIADVSRRRARARRTG